MRALLSALARRSRRFDRGKAEHAGESRGGEARVCDRFPGGTLTATRPRASAPAPSSAARRHPVLRWRCAASALCCAGGTGTAPRGGVVTIGAPPPGAALAAALKLPTRCARNPPHCGERTFFLRTRERSTEGPRPRFSDRSYNLRTTVTVHRRVRSHKPMLRNEFHQSLLALDDAVHARPGRSRAGDSFSSTRCRGRAPATVGYRERELGAGASHSSRSARRHEFSAFGRSATAHLGS